MLKSGVRLGTKASTIKENVVPVIPEGLSLNVTHSQTIKDSGLNQTFIYDKKNFLVLGDGDGASQYYSRKDERKTALKWGQLKLFTTELEFLNTYWDPNTVPNPLVVYVGSAPGTHINILAKMFPQIQFHLYDGRAFDASLKTNPNISTFQKLFMDEDVQKYTNRNDVFFISDIRSLNYNSITEQSEETQRINEEIADRDMKLQSSWVQTIKPVKAHLKFRLPYSYAWRQREGLSYTYLDGDVYKQAFAPLTSTEARLVPDLNIPLREWNYKTYEEMMFYHNSTVREKVKFVNPLTNINEAVSKELGLLQDFDSIAFVTTVQEYLIKFGINPSPEQTLLMCRSIIDSVGNGVTTLVKIRSGDTSRDDEMEE